MGEFEKAVEDSTRELQRVPSDAPSRLLRGLSYLALGNWDNAQTDLEIASKAMPENAQAQFGLARTLIEKNEFSRAEVLLRRSMELDKTDPGPVNTLIRLLLQQGRRDEAAALRPLAVSLGQQSRSAAPGEIRFQNREAGTP